jgi:putative nucleotidyltransferase with HDIG domain
VGLAINLAVIIVGGPLTATLVSAFGVMLRVPKKEGIGYIHIFKEPIYKTLFNMSNAVIAIGISALAYHKMLFVFNSILANKSGILYSFLNMTRSEDHGFSLIPTLLTLPVYVFLNTIILARLLSFLSGIKFFGLWLNNVVGVLASSLAVGSIGVIMALSYSQYGIGAVLLFFGPLLLARFSFKLYIDMRNVYVNTIQLLNRTMEAKDSYTSGHAARVQEYAVSLAKEIGMSERKIENIRKAAILHDIGKIGIDDSILKKSGSLTAAEYSMIKQHPVIGAEILKDVDFLKEITEIIRHHHERYDGKGYPDGLKGDAIPIEAAILAIADVYDAMTSNRPYRSAMEKDVALREIRQNAGTQFDPILADKFVQIIYTQQVEELVASTII